MRARSLTRRIAGSSAVALATVLAISSPALASGTWARITSVNKFSASAPTHNQLTAVSGSSSNAVWGVGNWYSTTTKSDQTLAEFWNGAKWKISATADAGTGHNELDGVATISATDAWAAGYYYSTTALKDRTLIEHYHQNTAKTGYVWTRIGSPNVGTDHNELLAIAAVPGSSGLNLWAVGLYYNTTAAADRTLIEHYTYDSATKKYLWRVVKSPNVGTDHNELDAIAVDNKNEISAVGTYYDTTAAADQTLVEHWNGTAWSVVSSPDMTNAGVATHNVLDAVAYVPGTTKAWAVGTWYDGSNDQTLTEKWNGTTWSMVPSPDVTGTFGGKAIAGNRLAGVYALSATDVIAVGTYDVFDSTANVFTQQSLAEQWGGSAWTVDTTPQAAQTSGSTPTNNTLYGIGASGSKEFAVGFTYNGTTDQTLVLGCPC